MVKRVVAKPNSRQLKASMKGFMLTCDCGKEDLAAAELKSIVEKRVGEVVKQEEGARSTERKQKLLKLVETGCKGVLFLKVNPGHQKFTEIDPHAVVSTLFTSPSRSTQYLCKIVPIQATCSTGEAKQIISFLTDTVCKSAREKGDCEWKLDFLNRNSVCSKASVIDTLKKSLRLVDRVTHSTQAPATPSIFLHANRRLLLFSMLAGVPQAFSYNLKRYYRLKHIP